MSYAEMKARFAASEFRSRFKLTRADRAYLADRGWEVIRGQAARIIRERLAPAFPANDGRQTPMRGHPVFVAQHATACCCRGCLRKWHGIPEGIELDEAQRRYIADVLMAWIARQMEVAPATAPSPTPAGRRRARKSPGDENRGSRFSPDGGDYLATALTSSAALSVCSQENSSKSLSPALRPKWPYWLVFE